MPIADPKLRRLYGNVVTYEEPDLLLGTYRRSVSGVIPEMSNVAWDMKKRDLQKAYPGITHRQFVYRLSRARYRNEWNEPSRKPGTGARGLAFWIRICPKWGRSRF